MASALLLGGLLFGVNGNSFMHALDQDDIHLAVADDDVARVELILDRHPDRLESRNRLGLTPLHEAAWKGHTGVLELLIRRGADVNARWSLVTTGDGGRNPLHMTAIKGHAEAARC
jgi:ankyrin repeat protein